MCLESSNYPIVFVFILMSLLKIEKTGALVSASFDLVSLSLRDGEEQERMQSVYAWARMWVWW